jgi:hypothetical protein
MGQNDPRYAPSNLWRTAIRCSAWAQIAGPSDEKLAGPSERGNRRSFRNRCGRGYPSRAVLAPTISQPILRTKPPHAIFSIEAVMVLYLPEGKG